MSRIRSLSEIFAKNRTEELPDDLWKMFVHPRNEGRFDLKKWTKPTVLVGGRGSGKTMFLKYHCHPTTFSPKKDIIRNEDFEFIGFHWRPDTFFTQNINEKLLGEKWERSFNSLMTLTLLIDFAKMLENILRSKFNSKDEIEKIASFELPKPIRQKLGIKKEKFIDCKEELEDINFDLCNWINSPDSSIPPSFIDLVSSLKLITERLSINISVFQKSIFTIFVDEFENLTNQQQKIINTWLKHSSQNLIFSIAHKKHSEVSRETKSQEKIVGRNDFRLIDLDEIYSKDFENLAAEVFVLKWIQDNHITELEEFIDICSDPELISTRRSDKYLKNIKFIVQKILPKTTMSEISEDILKNNALNNKLKNLIDSGLKLHNSDYLISDFLDPNYKQASIVNGALLNRKSKSMFPEILHKEFLKYKNGEISKYDNWIPNNLKGVIIYIYNATPNRICPIYSGFDQFTLMSRGNLRHFIELCHQAIVKAEDSLDDFSPADPIPIDIQAKATKYTSKLELDKIADLGAHGNLLKRIALRFGILFLNSQARKSQSEPEVNHFSIPISGLASLDKESRKLLNECLVWSVLFEEASTKVKSDTNIESYDYILHPVLSSHFGISPTKRRKLSLSSTDFSTIIKGSDEDFKKLLNNFQKKWKVNEDPYNSEEKNGIQLSFYD